MARFKITTLPQTAVLYLYSTRDHIQTNPEYQRASEVWTPDKRQLLVDSLLNGFDIPKIYFHALPEPPTGTEYEYAIIDGKQRLETIWSFINDEFPLAESFEYVNDKTVQASGLTYSELAVQYPKVKQRFDSTSLSVFVVETDEVDFIDEMFSRLNEAVPLNAAEKRNAFGGPLPKIIREVAKHDFFATRIAISNKRYQHRDFATKCLFIVHSGKVMDTKKVYLDEFVRKQKGEKSAKFRSAQDRTTDILDAMSKRFEKRDRLLRSAGMTMVYFILMREAIEGGWADEVTRAKLQGFEDKRAKNRVIAEKDLAKAEYDLLEFDRLTQSPNDGYALRLRLEILCDFFGVPRPQTTTRIVKPVVQRKTGQTAPGE
ncbi:MAG: hypothetical protein C0404_10230 [Verrucomicrobia bacterium]|nr:hypothetical protein [Verrucomicrobiota bacterium]